MAQIEEMLKWNYAQAWKFFSENAVKRKIPEAEIYVRSLPIVVTQDLRGQKDAHKNIMKAVKAKTLVFIDGASLNGKSTFAKRLAKYINANVIDIDILCKKWVEKEVEKISDFTKKILFLHNMDKLTDDYLLHNLEKIIREKSKEGNVILVGSYMEVVYRSIIARVMGQYFNEIVSIYCCARSWKEVRTMKLKRDKEFGDNGSVVSEKDILKDYKYSKRLLQFNGRMLGFGMSASFIADNTVSDMFT